MPQSNSRRPVQGQPNYSLPQRQQLNQQLPQHGYGNAGSRRPPKKPWLLIIGISVGVLALMGGAVGVALTMMSDGDTTTADDRRGLVGDALTLNEIRRSAVSVGASDVRVPTTLDEALQMLEYRDIGKGMSESDRIQKFVAAEWLYGVQVDESRRPQVAKSLALIANDISGDITVDSASVSASNNSLSVSVSGKTTPTDQKLKISILRAFNRWGSVDTAPLLVKHRGTFDDVTPYLLETIELYPSAALMDNVIPYLSTNYVDSALRIIKKIESESYSKLIPVIDGTDAELSRRILAMFVESKLDPDDARVDYYIAMTNSVFGRSGGWAKIAGLNYNSKYQPKISDALKRYDRSRQLDLDFWLDACNVWGDKSNVPEVLSVLELKWPFNITKVVRFLEKNPDPRTVPVLVDGLLLDRFANSDAYTQLLISVLKSGVEINIKNEVHLKIMRTINEWSVFNRSDLKDVLDATNFDYAQLVDQCISDLKLTSSRDHRTDQAIAMLAKMDVIESRRYEVAEALTQYVRSDKFAQFDSPAAFIRWATPKNDYIYELIEGGFFQKNAYGKQLVADALKIAIKGDPNKVILPIARQLDKNYGDECKDAMDALVALGPEGIDLCILLLNSSSPLVVGNACGVLGITGDDRCIEPLRKVHANGKRLKYEALAGAASQAASMINDRTGVLDREREAKKKKSGIDDGSGFDGTGDK